MGLEVGAEAFVVRVQLPEMAVDLVQASLGVLLQQIRLNHFFCRYDLVASPQVALEHTLLADDGLMRDAKELQAFTGVGFALLVALGDRGPVGALLVDDVQDRVVDRDFVESFEFVGFLVEGAHQRVLVPN